MPTDSQLKFDPSIILVVFLGFALFQALDHGIRDFCEARRKRRRAAVREAVEAGHYARVSEDDVFCELSEMLVELVVDISKLTNVRLRRENGKSSSLVVSAPEQQTRATMESIYVKLDALGYDAAVGAMAFMLKATADQVRRLRQRTLVFPVGVFLGYVCDGEFDIRLDRRQFTFESRRHAIWLLCDVFKEIRKEVEFARDMDVDTSGKRTGRKPRGRPPKKTGD